MKKLLVGLLVILIICILVDSSNIRSQGGAPFLSYWTFVSNVVFSTDADSVVIDTQLVVTGTSNFRATIKMNDNRITDVTLFTLDTIQFIDNGLLKIANARSLFIDGGFGDTNWTLASRTITGAANSVFLVDTFGVASLAGIVAKSTLYLKVIEVDSALMSKKYIDDQVGGGGSDTALFLSEANATGTRTTFWSNDTLFFKVGADTILRIYDKGSQTGFEAVDNLNGFIFTAALDMDDFAITKVRAIEVDTLRNVGGIITSPSQLFIDGTTNQPHLRIQAHSTQDSDIVRIEASDGTLLLRIDGDGELEIDHLASHIDSRALKITMDAAGIGGSAGMDLDLITGNIIAAEDVQGLLVNIDQDASTGGRVVAISVLTTTTGTATVAGIALGVGVIPISQQSGTFGNLTFAEKRGSGAHIDWVTAANSTVIDEDLWIADNDTVFIGLATTFEELEWIWETVATKDMFFDFFYSVSGPSWTAFDVIDGTDGAVETGIMAWNTADLTGWASVSVDGDAAFWIAIVRTRNTATGPTENLVQIAAPVNYEWSREGNIKVNSIQIDSMASFSGSKILTTDPIFLGDSIVADSAYATFQRVEDLIFDTLSGSIKVDSAGDGTNVVEVRPIIFKEGANITLTVDANGDTLTIAGPSGSGTADSMSVDTDGDGTIDNYLYSTVAGAFNIKKGTNITLTVDTDTLIIAATGGSSLWDSSTVKVDTILYRLMAPAQGGVNDTAVQIYVDTSTGTVYMERDGADAFIIKLDSIVISADAIGDFAGDALSVTSGILNVGGIVDAQNANDALDADKILLDVIDDNFLDVTAGGTGVGTLEIGAGLFGNGTGDILTGGVLADGFVTVGDGVTFPTSIQLLTSSTGVVRHELGGMELNVSGFVDGLYGMASGVTIDIDTEAEFETAIASINFVTVVTDDITSANLATAVSDEVGTGVLLLETAIVRTDGSNALTANWAAGDFDITGLESVKADTIYTNSDFFMNFDASTALSHLYSFNVGSTTGASLRFDSTLNIWTFTNSVKASGSIEASSNLVTQVDLFMNFLGVGSATASLFAFESGINTGASLVWDSLANNWTFSHDLDMGANDIINVDSVGLASITDNVIDSQDVVANALSIPSDLAIATKTELEGRISDVADFAEADGDIFTGVHDFGGATSLEIPNATNPAATLVGHIFFDTDDSALAIFDGAREVLLPVHFVKEFTIWNPDLITDTIPVIEVDSMLAQGGITLESFSATTSADGTYTLNLYEFTGADPPVRVGAGTIATLGFAAGDQRDATQTFSDDGIARGNHVYILTPATDIDWVKIKIRYFINAND